MKSIYEVDEFNKALSFAEHEKTNSADLHVFRLETNKLRDRGITIPLHRQHFLDITLFVDAGEAHEIYFDDKKQSLTTYTLQMVPPFKLISYSQSKESLNKTRGYTVLFSFDFLSLGLAKPDFINEFSFFNLTTKNSHFVLSATDAEKFISLFEKMLYEYENNQQRSKQILQGYLWVMLNECKKIVDACQPDESKETKGKQPQKLFVSFQNLLANNIHGRYAVECYAEMLYVSTNHLTQTVKDVSGKTPKQFITERRLIEAKCLLQYTQNSIAEIASLLNFSEPTHFVKFFKKETGKTPMEFRLKNQQRTLLAKNALS
jgi:AraC family transcriptional regulator, transcriptional activator of pobA